MRAHFVLLWVLLVNLSTGLMSQEFRMETDVYSENSKTPIASNLTLFAENAVYDFLLSDPEEVTVFDPVRKRFLLLHTGKQVRTTVNFSQLQTYVATMRAQETNNNKNKAAFLDPQFEESVNTDTNELTLTSRPLTYRVKGSAPQGRGLAERYQEFADWHARLNSMMRPGGMPPFGRIQLNKAVAGRGWIPDEIHRTVVVADRLIEKRVIATTKHRTNWILSATDRKRMETVAEQLERFNEVSPEQYLQTVHQLAANVKR